MKLQIVPIEVSTIERDVYTRPEFREIKVVIEAASLDSWFAITGFETKEEIAQFCKFARNGRTSIQSRYKKHGIKLEIKTDIKRLLVEVCKTLIPPKEIPVVSVDPAVPVNVPF